MVDDVGKVEGSGRSRIMGRSWEEAENTTNGVVGRNSNSAPRSVK